LGPFSYKTLREKISIAVSVMHNEQNPPADGQAMNGASQGAIPNEQAMVT
jgi:hypothetical protein